MANFTDLPREIRDEIYAFCLEHVRAVESCYERFVALDMLSASRQVGSEAAETLLHVVVATKSSISEDQTQLVAAFEPQPLNVWESSTAAALRRKRNFAREVHRIGLERRMNWPISLEVSVLRLQRDVLIVDK